MKIHSGKHRSLFKSATEILCVGKNLQSLPSEVCWINRCDMIIVYFFSHPRKKCRINSRAKEFILFLFLSEELAKNFIKNGRISKQSQTRISVELRFLVGKRSRESDCRLWESRIDGREEQLISDISRPNRPILKENVITDPSEVTIVVESSPIDSRHEKAEIIDRKESDITGSDATFARSLIRTIVIAPKVEKIHAKWLGDKCTYAIPPWVPIPDISSPSVVEKMYTSSPPFEKHQICFWSWVFWVQLMAPGQTLSKWRGLTASSNRFVISKETSCPAVPR